MRYLWRSHWLPRKTSGSSLTIGKRSSAFAASLQERTPYRVRTGDVFRIAIDTTTRALAGEVHVAEGPPQPVTPVSMVGASPRRAADERPQTANGAELPPSAPSKLKPIPLKGKAPCPKARARYQQLFQPGADGNDDAVDRAPP